MSIFEDYAQVYDSSGQLPFSLQMFPYLAGLVERHPLPTTDSGKQMLELASGTGTVAIAYAKSGWRVYGVDGSDQMLGQARIKAEEAEADVLWSQQDMRRFVIPERVHLVTCLYDSINYMLTDRDLAAVFRRTYGVLQPGGLFLFDVNTACSLSTFWNGDTYYTDSDDLSVIWQSQFDATRQRSTVTVTCFQKVGDHYRKIVERHTEQAYPREQIATLLTDVGFSVDAQYDCFTFLQPNVNTYRIMWVARRPHEHSGYHE